MSDRVWIVSERRWADPRERRYVVRYYALRPDAKRDAFGDFDPVADTEEHGDDVPIPVPHPRAGRAKRQQAERAALAKARRTARERVASDYFGTVDILLEHLEQLDGDAWEWEQSGPGGGPVESFYVTRPVRTPGKDSTRSP